MIPFCCSQYMEHSWFVSLLWWCSQPGLRCVLQLDSTCCRPYHGYLAFFTYLIAGGAAGPGPPAAPAPATLSGLEASFEKQAPRRGCASCQVESWVCKQGSLGHCIASQVIGHAARCAGFPKEGEEWECDTDVKYAQPSALGLLAL